MIIKAKENQLNIVREITQRTISEVYPKYYPVGAVDFFKEHHNDGNILKDIKNEIVFLLLDQEQYVRTVTIKNNEICRLFVLPEFQHHGYGRKNVYEGKTLNYKIIDKETYYRKSVFQHFGRI